MEKIKLSLPVIVEGKYDKARLVSVIDATILTTDGFGIFKSEEKRALIRRLGERGVIVLCDSDGGGSIIRSHLRGMLGGLRVYDLYIPQIRGKERRKSAPSAAGYLGVEGVDSSVLREIFAAFVEANPEAAGGEARERRGIRKSLMYELGLNGTDSAQQRRDALCERISLPRGMSANALHKALEMLYDEVELEGIVAEG